MKDVPGCWRVGRVQDERDRIGVVNGVALSAVMNVHRVQLHVSMRNQHVVPVCVRGFVDVLGRPDRSDAESDDESEGPDANRNHAP